jgi:lipoprotein-releasing system ATP-binding protein
MIHCKNITKSFGDLQVLKGIDLTVSQGEIIAIVGPSGAGKTTLLQIMGTLDKPDSGEIFYGNANGKRPLVRQSFMWRIIVQGTLKK